MIKICVVGLGRTGQDISKVLLDNENIEIVAAVCNKNSTKNGNDLGTILNNKEIGVYINSSDNLSKIISDSKPDIAIDFSNHYSAVQNAEIFSKNKVNIVMDTTGFSESEVKQLHMLTKEHHNGIVYVPNITLGVNVLMLLSTIAASILNNYDFRIIETHHKYKKDSPSGTALKISDEIKKGFSNKFTDIPISSIRAGAVVGIHEVLVIGENDQIKISHESFSRKAFAEGTIRAINFIYKKSGFFEMTDVLNLDKILRQYISN